MSENLDKRENNKRTTIIVEDTENGAVRITVAGPPYPLQKNDDLPINLLTCDIPRSWLSDFKHKVRNRSAYASRHCTDDSHGPRCADCARHEAPAKEGEAGNQDGIGD
jgi:hypothetical protein